MGGLREVLAKHLPRDRYDDDGQAVGTYCICGEWEGDYFADGEAGPFDDHLAAVVLAWVDARLGGARKGAGAAVAAYEVSVATLDDTSVDGYVDAALTAVRAALGVPEERVEGPRSADGSEVGRVGRRERDETRGDA